MSDPQIAVIGGLGLWLGSTLVLARLRWFARLPLVERLRPYAPGGMSHQERRDGVLSVESFRDVVAPLCRALGEKVARTFGVTEALAVRLERVHSEMDVTGFRVRQVGWSGGAFLGAAVMAGALRPPPIPALAFILGAPLLMFLLLENDMARQSRRWQERLGSELPVVAEQMAMLLSAGFSLGAALNRLAERGRGCAARDMARVCRRMRQGLSEIDALREWATAADVEGLRRLMPILALNREAADLGRLLSEEARSQRLDLHRRLVEMAERRGQQVWVPVTVAALVPGVVFIAVPFLEAMRLFAAS